MEKFTSIDHILDFAIQQEQGAIDFYTKLASNARSEDMKDIFEQYAKEEVGHKAKLTKIKAEGLLDLPKEKIADMKIADYIAYPDASGDMNYEEALKVAMAREKAAFKLYSKLASYTDNGNMKEIFMFLAQEESKHKLRFEVEYDEYVYREN